LSGVQLVQQRLGLLQIERVEAFGEPAVDRREKIARLIPLAPVRRFAAEERRARRSPRPAPAAGAFCGVRGKRGPPGEDRKKTALAFS
jgi:hypothetical protein